MKLINRPWGKIFLLIVSIIVVSLVVVIWFNVSRVLSPIIPPTNSTNINNKKVTKKVTTNQKQTNNAKPAVQSAVNTKNSTTDPSSIWVVVNKQHPLSPIGYAPSGIVTTNGATISDKAGVDFDAMFADAALQGVNLTVVSSYRSYDTQYGLYNNYVAIYGQASTDTFSARPGYSEHQTGLAIDFGSSTGSSCNLDTCYGTTVEGQWLAGHAYQYGFLLRYTTEKQPITGYKSESWHYRYIGRELAADMKNRPITTLEEYFNISGGETYLQ